MQAAWVVGAAAPATQARRPATAAQAECSRDVLEGLHLEAPGQAWASRGQVEPAAAHLVDAGAPAVTVLPSPAPAVRRRRQAPDEVQAPETAHGRPRYGVDRPMSTTRTSRWRRARM